MILFTRRVVLWGSQSALDFLDCQPVSGLKVGYFPKSIKGTLLVEQAVTPSCKVGRLNKSLSYVESDL